MAGPSARRSSTSATTPQNGAEQSSSHSPPRPDHDIKPSRHARFATMPSSSRPSSPSPVREEISISTSSNAFDIMHEWELQSLGKWQHRLEEARRNKKDLQTKIDALSLEEKDIWAKSSPKEKDPKGKGKGSPKKVLGEYAEWVAFLQEEVVKLTAEMDIVQETEEKAENGVRRATARLERVRVLEDRWRRSSSPSPQRAASPSPQAKAPQASSHSRPTSPSPAREPSSARRGSNAGATGPPSPLRRGSDPTPISHPSSLPNRSATPDIASGSATTRGRPLKPSSRVDPWLVYEDRWHEILKAPMTNPIPLRFDNIPWPLLKTPKDADALTPEAIKAFLLSAAVADKDLKSRRGVLRAAILRWHPDKFLGRYESWVEETDKERVTDAVGRVIRALNEIMRTIDAQTKCAP